jgi:hypothetical protein
MPPSFAVRVTRPVAVAASTLAALLTLVPAPGWSDTYVIPHILEQQGTTASNQYHYDHTLFAFYGSGLAGTAGGAGATVDLYLYDNSTGNPLQTFGHDVCNPCTYYLGVTAPRKATIRIEDLINAQGGFDTPVKLGFGVIVVGGDAGGVSLESDIINSHTSAFDASFLSIPPLRLRSEDPGAPGATVFQLTHLLEEQGDITNTQYVFDQTIFATYTAGLAGTAAGAGATLDLYLYDNTGDVPLKNQGQNVCNPCTFGLGGANPRKQTIHIDDLIQALGAFDTPVKLGSAIMVVSGDAGNVTLEAITSNAHTGPFDVTQYGTPIEPVQVGSSVAVMLDPRPGVVSGLSSSPNPASGEIRFAFTLARAADVDLAVYDVMGRKVATVFQGPREAGRSELRWNGRGAAGKLESGIYFARLAGGDGSSLARVVLRP